MRARDPEGLRQLLSTHGARVRWSLRREFQNLVEDDFDEVLNAASYSAWCAVDSYDRRRGTLAAWFYVIARNAALGILRRESRERRYTELAAADMADLAAPRAADTVPDDSFARDLRACIGRLPRLQRAIVEADLATGDVAEAAELVRRFKTTLNSVYVSRSNARKRLRKCLAGRGHRFWGGSSSEADSRS